MWREVRKKWFVERGHRVTPFVCSAVCYRSDVSTAVQQQLLKLKHWRFGVNIAPIKTQCSKAVKACLVSSFERFTRQTIIKRRLFWHQGRESVFVWHRRDATRVLIHLLHDYNRIIRCWTTWRGKTWHDTIRQRFAFNLLYTFILGSRRVLFCKLRATIFLSCENWILQFLQGNLFFGLWSFLCKFNIFPFSSLASLNIMTNACHGNKHENWSQKLICILSGARRTRSKSIFKMVRCDKSQNRHKSHNKNDWALYSIHVHDTTLASLT